MQGGRGRLPLLQARSTSTSPSPSLSPRVIPRSAVERPYSTSHPRDAFAKMVSTRLALLLTPVGLRLARVGAVRPEVLGGVDASRHSAEPHGGRLASVADLARGCRSNAVSRGSAETNAQRQKTMKPTPRRWLQLG